jgi:hypothetical protein
VQLKAVKPAHTAFPDFGNILKNSLAPDTFVFANGDSGAVHQGDAGTFTWADGIEKKHYGNEYPVFNFHKAVV